ncbi:GNAT family N-acetyltransferase [Novosphingobium tardum]|uniref:GNAT family N-acetyltransferase n=1 Tax=Novosphingobium tardum TaxID=1538021 RepID=A0ABV8RKV5_9SPHN
MDGLTITRHDQGGSGEYQAHLDGSDHTGRLTYVRRGDTLVAEHTLVPSEIGGRGIAAKLVEAMIADARREGLTIEPQCSYVAVAFKRHPEWADLQA